MSSGLDDDTENSRNEEISHDETEENTSILLNGSGGCMHKNYPFICERFVDPDTNTEMVYMAVNMPSGAKDVQLNVVNDGTHVNLTYTWTKPMFLVEELFKAELTKEKKYHPKIMAAKSGLEKNRARIDATPTGCITIPLPIKVQSAASSFVKKDIQYSNDGTLIITAEFQGFIKDYGVRKDEV